ncbi:hypothetical protein JT215_04930, partial [Helicobacter pylori]|nr:hypothetical protein [Helicobacter pylori]
MLFKKVMAKSSSLLLKKAKSLFIRLTPNKKRQKVKKSQNFLKMTKKKKTLSCYNTPMFNASKY